MSKERAQFFWKLELVLSVRCFLQDPKLGKESTMPLWHKVCYNLVDLKSICSWNTKSTTITQCTETPDLSNTHSKVGGWDNLGGLLYCTSPLLFCL